MPILYALYYTKFEAKIIRTMQRFRMVYHGVSQVSGIFWAFRRVRSIHNESQCVLLVVF